MEADQELPTQAVRQTVELATETKESKAEDTSALSGSNLGPGERCGS